MEPNGEMGAEEIKSNETKESSCSESSGHCQIRGEENPEGVVGEKHHAGHHQKMDLVGATD